MVTKNLVENGVLVQSGVIEGNMSETTPDCRVVFPDIFKKAPQVFFTFEPIDRSNEIFNTLYGFCITGLNEKEVIVRIIRWTRHGYPNFRFNLHWLAIGG